MFKGSIVALITPFLQDRQVDFPALERLIDWHIAEGTDGLVIVGTTGESATLSVTEHRSVIRHAIQYINKRIPVIAGTGANSTQEAIELTQKATEDGADACLLVVPYYNKPPQEGLYQHFKTIAEAVAIPQFLYNVPGRTVTDILPETVQRLSQIDNIVGIKEATGSMDRLQALQSHISREDFTYLTGDDGTAYQFMELGGHGGISVTGNVAPKLNHQLYALALAGDLTGAKAVDDQLRGLHEFLFCEPNPIPVKWALSQMGMCGATLRLPLVDLDASNYTKVEQAMNDAGITLS